MDDELGRGTADEDGSGTGIELGSVAAMSKAGVTTGMVRPPK
jgi:hypothetical protein